jgi:hypothetical protein
MEKTILLSLPLDELKTIITDCVNTCLFHDRRELDEKPSYHLLNLAEAAVLLDIPARVLKDYANQDLVPHFKRGYTIFFFREEITLWHETWQADQNHKTRKSLNIHQNEGR